MDSRFRGNDVIFARNDTAGLATCYENARAPLGERVACDGAFISPSADGVG